MADDFFTDFELIPPDVDVLDPDEELADFVDPDNLPTVADSLAQPIGRNLFYDDETGQLGDWVDGIDAVVQTAKIAMMTKRGGSIVFPASFGREEPERQIGRTNDAEARALAQADARATLLACHERIVDARDFVFHVDDSGEIGYEDVTIEIDVDQGENVEARLQGIQL